MVKHIYALVISAMMLGTTPVLGADDALQSRDNGPATDPTPQEMFEEATRTMLQALKLLVTAIPQYEAPEVLENGDILIRRKNPTVPDDEHEEEPEEEPGQHRI